MSFNLFKHSGRIEINYTKFTVAAILTTYYLIYSLGEFSDPVSNWNFLDSADLIIHEAGHTIFMFAGQFIHVLGGSLTQILLPCVFIAYFYLRREYFSVSVLLFWLAQNIFSVATYIGDSIAQQLPLLGGDGVIHDWNYILSTTGLLKYTDTISHVMYIMGYSIIICAIVLCFRFSVRKNLLSTL